MADIKIPELPEATTLQDSDLFILEQGTGTKKVTKEKLLENIDNEISTIQTDISTINSELSNKMNLLSSPTANDILLVDSNGQAIDSGVKVADLKVLVVTSSSFNSLPQTITNANITSDMVVVNSVLSNPSVQTGNWTITTSNGSLTISGSISGSTTLTLYLEKQR